MPPYKMSELDAALANVFGAEKYAAYLDAGFVRPALLDRAVAHCFVNRLEGPHVETIRTVAADFFRTGVFSGEWDVDA